MSLERALKIAILSLAFGRVERLTRHEDGIRPETDSDHTVMLGLIACELAPDHLCRNKVAAFSNVHDIDEVYGGDTPTLVTSQQVMKEKKTKEDAASIRLAAELGEDSWIVRTLEVYKQQREPEARFVRLMDKVLPKLTHSLNRCAAVKNLMGREDLLQAHSKQLDLLRKEYPEFQETLELLEASMNHTVESWGSVVDLDQEKNESHTEKK